MLKCALPQNIVTNLCDSDNFTELKINYLKTSGSKFDMSMIFYC